MKTFYLIAVLTLFTFTGCQKKNTEDTQTEDISVTTEDTTSVVQDGTAADTTAVDMDTATETNTSTASESGKTNTTTEKESKGKLLDKISVTTVKTNPATGQYTLAGTTWRLTELRGKAVNNTSKKPYTLYLNSKTGKFSTYVGCNSFTGNYLMKDAGLLSFSMVAGTKMACDGMEFENDYMKALDKVNNYMIEGNMLHLHRGNRVFAKFEAFGMTK